ncbi:hypothetical protein HYPSUDRAFT_74168 [Hypholoma sublateritium FD-334 SS-4]|uniref:Conserved oligomeric Golgi complex subunit 1 n=1 Tax=Hypholoma sublateritium (strain FD-334 SS-4) TaxID=945553 RepID=A0A0D2MWC6_HYPSF|nr:hypothetical protein HYPSUDRAFT_74168 [Hypholoma sublateritium FD-334 SS-4]
MSVLSPAHSTRSFLSPKSSGYNTGDFSRRTSGISPGSSRAYTQALVQSAKLSLEGLNLSPDELFTKHTVSEVRAVQQRLKTDADAKQEELRLMVGERYRDLLQASTSIIAIAKSSQYVLHALEESREAITSQHDLPLPPKTASIDGLDDRHLSTLQVLSAHMKLLLDAPEHLWRLIERKHYLQAAWLFLLSRVVHRALVRQDDNDEQSWVNEGVDVLAEFPLVQRQWEVVSQFRPQIIHKSTLSLREIGVSSEETCATLATLHLLDSRPLTETLATLLSQRSKTLQSILSWKSYPGNSKSSETTPANGHAGSVLESMSLREVTQSMKKAFNTIAQTLSTANIVFQDESSKPSLILCVLRSMQDDKPDGRALTYRLPNELQVTTQSLLTQLTSSANFQLLPANLRSYKPYVDLNSSSTRLPPMELAQRLQEWFQSSCDHWRNSAAHWLQGLQSLKEVWTLRNSMLRCITGSRLKVEQILFISSQIDSLYHERIIGIWQRVLSDAEAKFKKTLYDQLSCPTQSNTTKNISPVDFLFQPPSIPILAPTIKSFVDTPFQKYQLSLKRQLVGRSTQLESVLGTVEQCARAVQQDFLYMKTGDDETARPLMQQLIQSYQPAANSFTVKVVDILDQANSAGLVFLSRITDDLMSSSSFINNISCTQSNMQEFGRKVSTINRSTVRKWGEITIHGLIEDCKTKAQKSSKITGLSTALLHGLLSLSDYLRQLGVIHHPVKKDSIVQETLHSFITLWINEFWGDDVGKDSLFDVLFLSDISTRYGEPWSQLSGIISQKLKSALLEEETIFEDRQSVSEYLSRTQTLFAILLPPPPTPIFDSPLSRFGTPTAGQGQQSAIDLAKPSPRFGMLLVGNVNADR